MPVSMNGCKIVLTNAARRVSCAIEFIAFIDKSSLFYHHLVEGKTDWLIIVQQKNFSIDDQTRKYPLFPQLIRQQLW